jgi:hypothetical protein
LTDAQADALPAPCARFLLGCIRELSSDPLASSLWQDEDVLNLGNAEVCTDPGNVRVPDRPIIVPCDEIGRALFNLLVETAKRQALIDIGDLAWLQLSYRQHGGKVPHTRVRPRRTIPEHWPKQRQIPPVTAQQILAYRDANGAFRSVDELDAVPGIGPATLEQLRPLVDL